MTYEELNHSLRAHLIANGLIAPPLPPSTAELITIALMTPPLPPSTGGDDSNDISMTPVADAPAPDANDTDYVQTNSSGDDDNEEDPIEQYDAEDDQLVHEGDLEVLASAVAQDASMEEPSTPPPLI
jgi:hypothetical protein